MKTKYNLLNNDPTYLGAVMAVSGSSVSVQLSTSVASGLSIIGGRTYRTGQVGSFTRIPQGYQDLFGIVSEIGIKAVPEELFEKDEESGKWIQIQLVGESIGGYFERGISQYPNIGDNVHLVTEDTLAKIYGSNDLGDITIGTLSSAESVPAKITLKELITRHSAVLGSTGSGKSTTVASLLRSVCAGTDFTYPSGRMLMLDIHGEYSKALEDIANIFSIDPHHNEEKLFVPYWALDSTELLEFLTGGLLDGQREAAFIDEIRNLKLESYNQSDFPGLDENMISIDTPIPFSIKKLWYELIDFEIMTLEGENRDQPARISEGDIDRLLSPTYKPHGIASKPPYINPAARGIRKQLNVLYSRMVDKRYDFLLQPGPWEPNKDGVVSEDLDTLLHGWLGGENPITILDLSSVPSAVLEILIGSILKIIYYSLYWGREQPEGGVSRPLLIVMEEAHRYLASEKSGLALDMVKTIAKEGRKYGVGAMVISQRPSEVDETILSQCGTYFTLRLSNPTDRQRVGGTLPDNLTSLVELLPVLRTGEAVVMGEATKLPMRCRITLPRSTHRPKSTDPEVEKQWSLDRSDESYGKIVASWRAQDQNLEITDLSDSDISVEDQPEIKE